MKEHYINHLTRKIKQLKNKTKHLEINDESLNLVFSPDSGYEEYTIISTEKYNPAKHSFDYIKELLELEESFSPSFEPFYYDSDTIEQNMLFSLQYEGLDLCPQLTAGCKFIPFPCLDESRKNETFHSPDGKLLIYFFNSSSSQSSKVILLEKLINKINELTHIEYQLVNLINAQDMNRSQLEEKFEFIKKNRNYFYDMRIEKSTQINRLYNIIADLSYTRIIIVNLFEKVIFNGPLHCEENIHYIIGKINENAFKENFEVTEEDEFMGKIASKYMYWFYGKEPLEKLKNKSFPETIEDKHICLLSYTNNNLILKYLYEIVKK